MANWQGYLLKSGGEVFPHQYIIAESWESTPNQREEIKAYRDDNTRNLTRITAQGTKSKIKFSTRRLTLDEKEDLLAWFTRHESNHLERKINITFWNDDTNSYSSGDFYRTDTKFKIREISQETIKYDTTDITLIEY